MAKGGLVRCGKGDGQFDFEHVEFFMPVGTKKLSPKLRKLFRFETHIYGFFMYE